MRIRKSSLIVSGSLVLMVGAFTILCGIPFKWYRAPYSSFGKHVAWAISMPESAYNFAAVTPPQLYRSGEPDADFLAYVQHRYGIKYLVSLSGPLKVHRTARKLGMEVIVLDWRTTTPTSREIRALLAFLSEKRGVLVHCHAGRDRTGYVIGLYRMLHDHWSLKRALHEMEANGHSRSHHSETQRLLQNWRTAQTV